VSGDNHKVDYYFPKDVQEASQWMQQYGDKARLIAGGTDLLLWMERQGYHPKALIDLTRIPELQKLEVADDQVLIGSAVTYSRLLKFPALTNGAPFLARAIRTIGGVQIRNIATLAGNVTNASPAGDSLPPLYCLEAQVGIYGAGGRRSLPIQEFILGVRRTALAPGELVTHLSFQLPGEDWQGVYEKLGLRRAMAIAVANLGLLLKIEAGRIREARLALGAVAPTVIRASQAETYLQEHALDEQTIEATAELATQATHPIDDVRASARYRREAVRGLVRRALRAITPEAIAQE